MSKVLAKRRAAVDAGMGRSPMLARAVAERGPEQLRARSEIGSPPSPCQAEFLMHPAGWSTKRGLAAAQGLSGHGRFSSYVMRGRWLSDDRYGALRNAAWMLRNSRVGTVNNPAALRLVIREAEVLVGAGDPLADVLEAFAELLIHP